MNTHVKTQFYQRIQRLYQKLTLFFPPEEDFLQQLAKSDRPGVPITLPQVPISALERGRASFSSEQYAEALFHFSQAIEENPHSAWAWHGKGDAFQLLGDYKEALECYQKAIEYHPTRSIHQAGKANALRGLGQEEEYQRLRRTILLTDPSLEWMLEA